MKADGELLREYGNGLIRITEAGIMYYGAVFSLLNV